MNGQQERVMKRYITMANELENNNGDIIIYQLEDGRIKLNVRLENNTVWLTKDQVAEFYEEARATIY